ncbi:MAG: hypothetical protein JNM94_05780 [Phycisphaerae bacterium]|nr:hypothetical protein [Phycisphaerae bacterium]
MTRLARSVSIVAALVVAGAAPFVVAHDDPPAPVAGTRNDEGIQDRAWLYDLMRYLYRWHLDEEHIDVVARAGTVTFWVREVPHELDAGDRSRFGEVLLPQIGILVTAKKSDYSVPELELTVKSDRFKVIRVATVEVPAEMPAGYTLVTADYAHLRDELFRTRGQSAFPDEALLAHLREAARTAIAREFAHRNEPLPDGAQVVHLAPMPPVANEAWAYWEGGKMLLRFASDAELTNPGVWKHHDLVVDVYPLDKNVVVSLDEIAGSNAFMTRDQAGRALFNCLVLGKRVELAPREPNSK